MIAQLLRPDIPLSAMHNFACDISSKRRKTPQQNANEACTYHLILTLANLPRGVKQTVITFKKFDTFQNWPTFRKQKPDYSSTVALASERGLRNKSVRIHEDSTLSHTPPTHDIQCIYIQAFHRCYIFLFIVGRGKDGGRGGGSGGKVANILTLDDSPSFRINEKRRRAENCIDS